MPGHPAVRDALPDCYIMVYGLSQRLIRKSKLVGSAFRTKDDKLTLQEHIAVDREGERRRALDPAEARRRRLNSLAVYGGELDELAGHHALVGAHIDGEGRDRVLTVEDVAAVGVVELGAGDVLVVRRDDVIWEEHQGRARVGDGLVRRGRCSAAV